MLAKQLCVATISESKAKIRPENIYLKHQVASLLSVLRQLFC